jgi:hypothetical protein
MSGRHPSWEKGSLDTILKITIHTHVSERGRRGRGPHISEGGEGMAGWASRRPLGWLASGTARGRGEVGHGWVENRRWAKVQKEFLFEFLLILEFGRTLENCTRRFRMKFDMGIFPKIF